MTKKYKQFKEGPPVWRERFERRQELGVVRKCQTDWAAGPRGAWPVGGTHRGESPVN